MGVEEDGRERRVGPRPCKEKERLTWREFKGFVMDGRDGIGLGDEVGNSGGVIWIWVCGVYAKVALKTTDWSVVFVF